MKKLMILLITATMFSCGVKKIVTSKDKRISGNWYLDKISYSEDGDYNVTLFDDASKYCFEGSTWKFLDNTKAGSYVINKTSCATQARDFKYEIGGEDDETDSYRLTLTPLTGNTSKGYNLMLKDLGMSTMEWQEYRVIDGVKFTVIMEFEKFE